MFAIIETGGKQILVKAGDSIFIEKIGSPYIKNASVSGKIEKQGKAKKIVVYRHNAKSTHKRKLGHRQPYTRVKILAISEGAK